jgi:arginase
MADQRIIRIFGIPMDLGQRRRGVDMGPSALRYARLQRSLEKLGYDVWDMGNIAVAQVEELDEDTHEGIHHLSEVKAVIEEIYARATQTVARDEIAIFMGGDHSISIGTVASICHIAGEGRVGVVWVDAHGDVNTPQTSPSGSIHGMVIASLIGEGGPDLVNMCYDGAKMKPEQFAFVGTRDLDLGEKIRMAKGDMAVYTMRHIDEQGIAAIAYQILERFKDVDHLHISLDLDSLDPSIAPGVGTPVPGGLSYREAHVLMEIFADSGKVRSLDIVEVNPILDERNTTANMAVALTTSLFGQQILPQGLR